MTAGQNRDWCLLMAPLFEYPEAGYQQAAERAAAAMSGTSNGEMAVFLQDITGRELCSLQEAFIHIFDMNPECALDIGWHLFGEDYARGEFLVKLKSEHRRYGVDERSELPDHLPAVLRLLAAMPADEAEEFAGKFVAPALEKIRTNVKDEANPFARLLGVLAACLGRCAAVPANREVLCE